MGKDTGDERSDAEVAAETWVGSQVVSYEGWPMAEGGKRLGMSWTPWMADWFTSYSPRNDNSHGEGYWDHWVDLALSILSDPLTEIVRPGVFDASLKDKVLNLYDGANRKLTYLELRQRFDENAPGRGDAA